MTNLRSLLLILVLIVPLMGCDYRALVARRERWLAWRPESPTAERIQQYQKKIAENRAELQTALQAAGNIARFNKLLAIEYMRVGMFGLALDSLREALLIEPNNAILFYLSGVSAMRLAGIYQPLDSERDRLIQSAEHAFTQSMALDPDYPDPLLAISMLYVFERQDFDTARVYLERLRDIDNNNPHAHALLGRVYAERGELTLAAQSYRLAADRYQEPEYRQQSLENIDIIQSWGPDRAR